MVPEGPLFHKPKSIIVAKNILYASLFFGIINWAISQWTTDLNNNSPVQGIIILIVTLLVVLVLIRQIAMGKKWGRVVLLILFVAGMLAFPWTLTVLFKASLLVGVLGIFQALLQIAALIFLFSKESTQWFNRVHTYVQDKPVPASKH